MPTTADADLGQVIDASIAYLQGRLDNVTARIRQAVTDHRVPDPEGDERFRGLYISDAEVDALLAQDTERPVAPAGPLRSDDVEAAADAAEALGADIRLRRLARSFGLADLDVELLLVALAPDLDPKLERVFGYLHDDVSRRRASIGLVLELCGAWVQGRSRLGPGSPLVRGGLLVVEDDDRPFLTRSLRVPDRVAAHLLGDDAPDLLIAHLLTPAAQLEIGEVATLARALESGVRLVYVREPNGGAGLSMAVASLRRLGQGAIAVDFSRLSSGDDISVIADRLAREALLVGAGIVGSPVETLAERDRQSVRVVAECRSTVILLGTRVWDPQWSTEVPFVLDAPFPHQEQRVALWRSVLGTDGDAAEVPLVTSQFRLTPEQIVRAATFARRHATATQQPLSAADLAAASRAQNAAGLERLARRVAPRASWSDLVLTEIVATQVQEVIARVRQRERVLDEWGMGRRSSKGRGVKALFAGESGTGKTMSAEVAAAELGLDLYVIDLSTVVDKYVGETEKNLDRIFAEADRVNGVLLFEEADALFGKRSEVKDAQDRYANVEVAYLLQRMESFDGLAILTTNLRANLDEAFARRLDAIVDFPLPEEDDRRRLWESNLALGVPLGDDLDVAFMAQRFKLSGGNIRNIVLSAAFAAAESGRPLQMLDLVRGTEREYRKLGHLVVESEFGKYHRDLGLHR